MSGHSDPFRRNAKYGGLTRHLGSRTESNYQGQEGLETLFSLAMPHLLIRTDARTPCPCGTDGDTGSSECSRCFGTGKIVVSLDKIQAYVSKSSAHSAIAPVTTSGWEFNDSKTIYTGRWVHAQIGDLILEVGWDLPNELVFQGARVQTVDNVYQVKQNNHIGFQHVSYSELSTVFANTRKQALENILLFAPILPPWKNCLAS